MVTTYLIGAVSLALLCGVWALFQRWVAQKAPGVRGPEDSGGGCCGACTKDCDKEESPSGA